MVMGVPCGHRGHLRVFGGGCGQWGASGTVGGMGHTGDIWWHWGTAARMGCDPPVRRRQHPGLAWVPPQPAWVPPPSAGRSLPAPPCLAALITTPLLITSPSPAPTTSTLTTSPHPPGHPWEPQPRLPALPPPPRPTHMATRRATVVPKRSKMKPMGKVTKLFMKEPMVKTRENCSSCQLQSAGRPSAGMRAQGQWGHGVPQGIRTAATARTQAWGQWRRGHRDSRDVGH